MFQAFGVSDVASRRASHRTSENTTHKLCDRWAKHKDGLLGAYGRGPSGTDFRALPSMSSEVETDPSLTFM